MRPDRNGCSGSPNLLGLAHYSRPGDTVSGSRGKAHTGSSGWETTSVRGERLGPDLVIWKQIRSLGPFSTWSPELSSEEGCGSAECLEVLGNISESEDERRLAGSLHPEGLLTTPSLGSDPSHSQPAPLPHHKLFPPPPSHFHTSPGSLAAITSL